MSVTLHHGTSFVVCEDDGDFGPEGALGFFHLDTRFLCRHALRLDGKPPVLLQPAAPHAHEGLHFLTNPELDRAKRSTLSVVLRRELGGGMRETIEIENFGGAEAKFELSLSFDCDFEYILTVKHRAVAGQDSGWRPRVQASLRDGREVVLELLEERPAHRAVLDFDPSPDRLDAHQARFQLAIAPRGRWQLTLDVCPSIDEQVARPCPPSEAHARAALERRRELGRRMPRLVSDHPVLAAAVDQASRDLAALRIKADGSAGEDGGGGEYAIAAGIPWYMDLFGRDSLVASYESMLHDPDLARGTLDGLAALQGTKVDPVTEEAPGKILHEFRRGPLTPAARKLIPAYPYYGTIDATPLFVITLSEYVRVTGDLEYARGRWESVRAAIGWMRRYGDRDGDGFLEYERDSALGLVNQGWKDSSDSVRFRDGRVATPPIALVEVQGYAYAARRRAAELARHLGLGGEAERLEEEAAALRRRLRARFWIEERAFYAEALDGGKQRVDALTSNPGHLLWTGAVDPDHARAIAAVLLSDEMFTGFGVRTMGEREGGYNPVSYHDGSVWPHDNALILAGLARYGLHEEATRLAVGLLAALGASPDHEPPELFCGYPAARYDLPVRYPSACRPQAWASGAVILLLRAVLSLEVDALAREVSLAPLALPDLTRLELHDVPAGGQRFDVDVRVQGGVPVAEVKRLPAGWRRVERERAGS